MKQFVVIGLGNFGFNVARALYTQGHHVLAIDADEKKIEKIKNDVTDAISGDARDEAVLREFVSDTATAAIISLGDNMEGSVLCTMYLKEIGVRKIIVKAINDDHRKVLERIGATETIFPEREAGVRLAQRLSVPNLIEHIPLAPDFSISQIETPVSFVGKTLKDLSLPTKYGIQVIAVKDVLTDEFYVIPGAEFKIMPDSALLVIGKSDDLSRLRVT
jgi:trk system potassium uptake protein